MQGKDTAGLGDDVIEALDTRRKNRTATKTASKRDQRKRKRMGDLGDSAEKNSDSDDESSASGMHNSYLDRLPNVVEKFATAEDTAVGNKIAAAIGLQNNNDPVAAKMGTDYLMGILTSV
jgi:hypothetical protein